MSWFTPAARPPVRKATSLPLVAVAKPDRRSGCGWFDSSWELSQGLLVEEHTGFERLPAEVPLEWLLQ